MRERERRRIVRSWWCVWQARCESEKNNIWNLCRNARERKREVRGACHARKQSVLRAESGGYVCSGVW